VNRDASLFRWIKREEEEGRIYQEVDGYYVWSPNSGGFVNEYALGYIASYLAAKNAAWDWQIQHDPAVGGGTDDSPTEYQYRDVVPYSQSAKTGNQ
jgi:hypothetical protein